ncbi:MAG TPA: GntR family transcriptional regulator [Alphaproteobacteria bacterium]|nr:GntR family transcriptional regulator [Alphaproteobacteria bacterium]
MTALKLAIEPIEAEPSFRDRAYSALKRAITTVDIYATREEIRLDERQLSQSLGISRTPIREALNRLEQEGFIRSVPRRGMFIVRKTKQEILDIVRVWAALESMAARLITLQATDEEISSLRRLFTNFEDHAPKLHIDEYSEANIRFHQAIVSLSKNKLLIDTMETLFVHMRSIRRQTISEDDRATRSIIDHMNIIEALEKRQTERAEQLVRQHSLDLATHVEKHVDYLD